VDPGNLVRATDAGGLVLINQVDPIAVSFTVPDTAFAQVQSAVHAAGSAAPGLAVEVYGRGQAQRLGRGALVLVDNRIDAASGTLRLKARLDNPDLALWPGQTVDVRLILGDRAGALVVPESAVQRGADGLFVYVVGPDDHVRLQMVRMAVAQDGLAVVTEGLSAGQRVVIDGQYKLRPGLRIAEAAADAPGAAATDGKAAPGATGNAS
jgi:multidrug efflux system membrane fusion protein